MQHEPPTGPLEIVDVVDASAGECTIVVNAVAADPLNDPAALGAAAKWTMRLASTQYVGLAIVNVSFDRFRVQFTAGGFFPGPNVISYANAPSDIATVSGRMLPAVTDQPF